MDQTDIIRNLISTLEREASGVHLHTVPAYRDAVLYLRERSVEYDSPEARLVAGSRRPSKGDNHG